MRRAALLLLLASFSASAIVIRDDVPDLQYRMAVSEFPALADMPGVGHGVLISPQWVITAAHAVSWQHSMEVVVVGGTPRAVRNVVIHPGYKQPPQEMINAALKSGDWEAFFEFIGSSDDIALIQLAEPIVDITPVRIHVGGVATGGSDAFDSDVLVGVNGRWQFRPNFALVTGYEYGKITTFNLGLRYSF